MLKIFSGLTRKIYEIKKRYSKSIEKITAEWLGKADLRVKKSSSGIYHGIAHNHILPYFKDYGVSEITRSSVEKFIDFKLKKLSPKTVRDITSVLIQIIKFAERNRYIKGFNYDIDLPKLHIKEIKLLNFKEEQTLDEYLKGEITPENFGVILAKEAGLRIGEICALQWVDFNLDTGTVSINKTIQRIKNLEPGAKTKTKVTITEPKSRKSIREISLPANLIPIVKKLYNYDNPGTYLLTGTVKYIEPRNFQRKFKKLLKVCGITYVNFHSLRHSFASNAVKKDFDEKTLSEILGHSTVKFTFDRYVHSNIDLQREHMNKMASGF